MSLVHTANLQLVKEMRSFLLSFVLLTDSLLLTIVETSCVVTVSYLALPVSTDSISSEGRASYSSLFLLQIRILLILDMAI